MKRPYLLGSLSFALLVAAACGTDSSLPDNGGAAGTRSTTKTGKGGSSAAGNDGGGGDESGAGGDEGNEGGSSGAGGTSPGKGGASGKGGSSTLSCESGKGDCNVDKADGCETDLTNSLTHCGSCGNACDAGTGGQEIKCEEGKCVTACIAFTGDCDGDAANGCETDTSSDVAHCGSCSAAPCKDGPHGAAACDGGTCGLACEKGWGDCDGNPANGCELDLSNDPEHCGSCTTSCEGKACTNSACECAASATTAETLPLDIFLMLDKSSSMDTAVGGGSSETKWKLVIQALNGFIGGVTAADQMGMGFGLFPASGGSCNISAFNKATVAVGDLPGNASALTSGLNGAKPNGSDTPTKPALEGAIDFAKKRLTQFPQRKIAVVLATDGEPNECTSGFPTFPPKDVVTEITAVAKAGADAGIPTYAIGVFASGSSNSSKSNIEKWAKAGGTQKGFIVSVDPQLAENLKKSLDEIRKTAIGCEYKVPQPAGGKALDPQKVNVVHTPGAGGTPNTLVYVPDAASCKPNAWYYDNPTMPAKILLCPQACDVIKPDQAGKVEISVGCATRVEN